MKDAKHLGRRSFIKASVLAGVAAPAVPVFAQGQGEPAPRKVAPPGTAAAAAENGALPLVDDEPQLVKRPGSDFMVDLLKATDTRYVAAMAGATFRGLHESIVNYGGNRAPELIVCVHEEISAGIAHGYAKVANQPMACLVHSTVGLLHASMAIYNAWCDRAPMMVIAGNSLDATKRRPGVEWVHSAQDLGAFVREYVKYDDTPVSLEHYAESYMRAHELSMTPPYEPVMIVADSELQEEDVGEGARLKVPARAPVSPPAAAPEAIERAAGILLAASAPLIVADRAARSQRGVDLIVELATLLNAPVIDRAGRLNMPTTHYLCQTSLQNTLVRQADAILGLELTDLWGTINAVPDVIGRPSRRIANGDAKVIGISANYGYVRSVVQDAQRYFAADLAIDADAEASLPSLIAAVHRQASPEQLATIGARTEKLKAAYTTMRADDASAAAIGWDASPISTARLSMEIWEQISGLDWGLVSNHAFVSSWPQRLWDFTKYHQYIGGEGGYGVGYGAPAAVGAALAHRDAGRIAVAIQCDGDLMMLPGALWTAAHHRLPLLMVMHNNRSWHQETMHLKRMAGRRDRDPYSWAIGTMMTDPEIDFAQIARGMGVHAEGPISKPNELVGALQRALEVVKSGRPALLDTLTQMR
ncbi:thiamine pyrophosphate-binding protein [Sphingomonas panacis]|uniref:Thiamine pyrophosphate-binding protein n=1 Tax=Sphingomonas panacis TaxID=1560345 RepID=A0A1B3ZCT9_9SPHN|nr:thiamine pyrophosphate-dependent enzyme [Sphingomonas panacis]AOH85244.1 thiamine pyrophosphate-binding protein [Sphingomonas panacis]